MKSIPDLTPREIARFWMCVRKVESGCWEWTAVRIGGYGAFYAQGQQRKATRVAWTLLNGPIPDGMNILHHCDNPGCVNPEHLYPGTTKQNAEDRVNRGRQPIAFGTDNPSAKLCPDDVRMIRRLYATGNYSYKSVGKLFGVGTNAVRCIITGVTWTHVK